MERRNSAIAVLVAIPLILGGMFAAHRVAKTFHVRPPSLEENFSGFLDEFLREVGESADAYKDERKILIEAVNPVNLGSAEYVQENYDLVRTIIPSLRKRRDVLLNIFPVTEERLRELTFNQPEEEKQAITRKWEELRQEQIRAYVDYFAIDEEILSAYEELMAFYYDRRSAFVADSEKNAIIFHNPQDAAQEQGIKQKIAALKEKQRAALER